MAIRGTAIHYTPKRGCTLPDGDWKNAEILYKDYDAHFMVMERSRDAKTHQVHYPVKRLLPGGKTDPAGMEIDLWIRSKEQNSENFPPYETFEKDKFKLLVPTH